LNFQYHLLQSSVSHDPSETLIWCSRNIYYHYQCWKVNSCAAYYVCVLQNCKLALSKKQKSHL